MIIKATSTDPGPPVWKAPPVPTKRPAPIAPPLWLCHLMPLIITSAEKTYIAIICICLPFKFRCSAFWLASLRAASPGVILSWRPLAWSSELAGFRGGVPAPFSAKLSWWTSILMSYTATRSPVFCWSQWRRMSANLTRKDQETMIGNVVVYSVEHYAGMTSTMYPLHRTRAQQIRI